MQTLFFSTSLSLSIYKYCVFSSPSSSSLSLFSVLVFIVKLEWRICPHETSMSIDLRAALDFERKSQAEEGVTEEWMDA